MDATGQIWPFTKNSYLMRQWRTPLRDFTRITTTGKRCRSLPTRMRPARNTAGKALRNGGPTCLMIYGVKNERDPAGFSTWNKRTHEHRIKLLRFRRVLLQLECGMRNLRE